MGFSWVTPVRGVQLVVAIITLGLSGYLVSKGVFWDSRYGFNVFTSLWTILVCAFHLVVGLAMSESFLANPIITLALDGLSWIFWVAAFACVAAIINAYDLIGGTLDGSIKALVAFGVIEWLLFTATAVFVGITGFRGSKGGAPGHQGV